MDLIFYSALFSILSFSQLDSKEVKIFGRYIHKMLSSKGKIRSNCREKKFFSCLSIHLSSFLFMLKCRGLFCHSDRWILSILRALHTWFSFPRIILSYKVHTIPFAHATTPHPTHLHFYHSTCLRSTPRNSVVLESWDCILPTTNILSAWGQVVRAQEIFVEQMMGP